MWLTGKPCEQKRYSFSLFFFSLRSLVLVCLSLCVQSQTYRLLQAFLPCEWFKWIPATIFSLNLSWHYCFHHWKLNIFSSTVPALNSAIFHCYGFCCLFIWISVRKERYAIFLFYFSFYFIIIIIILFHYYYNFSYYFIIIIIIKTYCLNLKNDRALCIKLMKFWFYKVISTA